MDYVNGSHDGRLKESRWKRYSSSQVFFLVVDKGD